ncbi:MAG TPA: MEDS domain-containing protein [Sandaracinaceae bacterium LLY-WYZ-13_1]|nr:MEDS domain-containing protein [Sandaracinaceae bacterium LLY-WYZ-13_1]
MKPVELAGGTLEPYYHACAFFDGRDEEYGALESFVRDGLEAGEKAVHIVGPHEVETHTCQLDAHGVDTERRMQNGQLEIATWDETYLAGGAFDPDAMMARLGEVIDAALAAGHPRARIVGHMDWAFGDAPGVERLIEYEARVNWTLAARRQPAVCVYQLQTLSGSMMLDILRTHPLVVMRGTLRENPFYVEPEELLQELRSER